MNETIYYPNEVEKAQIKRVCDSMFFILCKLNTMEQRVFALKTILDTFEEAHGIKLCDVVMNHSDNQINLPSG